ncbi:hypothetical protein BFU36_11225 [Sulfolobus sp. A20]|uniref:nucleotide-binding protein n=1 Tax=Sulfolobaceae TaxID=118883 RepID=UPI0008460971|nr:MULTISPECIES: AAA family ATPase [unclassified Sulfolobus]TRM76928.1 ParA family protein [Sulfolobus sp. E5]TRM77445.1 ParA family protein [Sulfolobus sp. A20-N-F8]TRM82457.1 ParA family protein [Sulfolobus sp. D5]TRM88235.1 ParA family protein [Sulfolobus sp. C3]TRN01504.1 ParA family protein [Sulfolobus sp. E1]TRN04022.1 ParA family protein [Sulfolobus sp. F1]
MTTISVTGIKGGVGKSTISTYLSIFFSNKYKVMLVDSDFLKYSSYLVKLYEKFLKNKQNLKVTSIDLYNSSYIDAFEGNNDYSYIVVDCPIYPEKGCNEILKTDITIYVSDVSSLDSLLMVAGRGESKKRILVVNMVPPYPEDIESITSKISKLNFDLKVVIPFIPKIFMSKFREINDYKVDMLEKIAEAIEKDKLNGGVLTPLPSLQSI